jgi:RNA polymerase sigma factor (sigma-70 family)
MDDPADHDLLREYATHRSEHAFSTLVQRHLDLVYTAALRLVRDTHLAEDVTQAVFAVVAREAAKLQQYTVFSAWLHRTTRNQAALLVRSEVRRRHRETAAAHMNLGTSEDEIGWDQVAPYLDDALDQLDKDDREALILRFFERKTAREIGERLGLGDEAAQKRVRRALVRLRARLEEKGVTTSASALGVVLLANAVQAAPTALAVAVSAASISLGVSFPTILTIMTSTKIQSAVIGLVMAGLATSVIIQQRNIGRLHDDLARLGHRTRRKSSDLRPTPENLTDFAPNIPNSCACAAKSLFCVSRRAHALRPKGKQRLLKLRSRLPDPTLFQSKTGSTPGMIPRRTRSTHSSRH